MVQRRASSPGTWLSQPASVSRATTPTRGLIPGEHYTAGIILTCYGLLTAVSTLLSILRERIEVNRAGSVDAFRDRIIVHSKRIVITMTPPPTAYSMLLGRFVFCVVSIAVAPSLVMPVKSLAADKKVDCGKILTEIESGKSAQEVAKMM